MKKAERKVFEKKLQIAIEKVLQDNNAETKTKTEKAVVKSIKKIAKKTDLKITIAAKKKKAAQPN